MPSMFGGSNTDKDYAPHMWIGDHFVGSKVEFKHDGKAYLTGVANGVPVAECRASGSPENGKVLVGDDVPPEVKQAAYVEQARRTAEIESVKTHFRKASLTRE